MRSAAHMPKTSRRIQHCCARTVMTAEWYLTVGRNAYWLFAHMRTSFRRCAERWAELKSRISFYIFVCRLKWHSNVYRVVMVREQTSRSTFSAHTLMDMS